MISLHYLSFISLISITTEKKLEFAFLNGFNVIRCSDEQVQVYQSTDGSDILLSKIIKCNNKKDIFHTGYPGFIWDVLKLICSSSDEVHEEQLVKKIFGSNDIISDLLPDAQGQLGQSKNVYVLQLEMNDDEENFVIKSNDQPVSDTFFQSDSNKRTIYIQFPHHPIICRIIYSIGEKNPCSSGGDQVVTNVDRACYYNPSTDEEPTAEELEAELNQVDEAEKPDDDKAYVLDLEKPIISSDDDNHHPNKPSNSDPKKKKNNNKKKVPSASNSANNENKSNSLKIIGLILGLLLLISLIGAVVFYFIRKNRLNQSAIAESLSSVNLETGNSKDSSALSPNETEQPLAKETNTGIPTNERLTKEKPNIAAQIPTVKKRQRAGANMDFNDDI